MIGRVEEVEVVMFEKGHRSWQDSPSVPVSRESRGKG